MKICYVDQQAMVNIEIQLHTDYWGTIFSGNKTIRRTVCVGLYDAACKGTGLVYIKAIQYFAFSVQSKNVFNI